MSATRVLLTLAGDIALLLWALDIVRNAVLSSFGSELRDRLARGLRTQPRALMVGAGVTAVLQSSTATAFMVSSLAAEGVIALVPALALMLGANIGTALVVQVLSFDVSWLFSLAIVVGYVFGRRSLRSRHRDVGRILVGIGIILLALRMLSHTVQPLAQEPVLREVLGAITADPILNLLVAAIITWLAHSSIVTILLVAALAAAGALSLPAALAMVLGANLGSALNPLLQSNRNNPSSLWLPLGNLVTRLAGCLIALPLLPAITSLLDHTDVGGGAAVVGGHLAFNVIVACLFLPMLPSLAAWLERRLPSPQLAPGAHGEALYLDEASIGDPAVALANATREALRMADVVSTMLQGTFEVMRKDDREQVAAITAMDDQLDRLHSAVTYYASAVGAAQQLSIEDSRRLSEILIFAVNLEHIGDVIEKSLMALARKRIDLRVKFDADVMNELDEIRRLLANDLQLAIATFMSSDERAARTLMEDKDRMRGLERAAAYRQFDLIRRGDKLSIQVGALVLDVFRDLKRVEAHLAATTHSVLEAVGGLNESRLTK